jgi:hypothetical protein
MKIYGKRRFHFFDKAVQMRACAAMIAVASSLQRHSCVSMSVIPAAAD